jgi:3-deoxy-D-manno-octulosonate 8-phosphate phosphatase (KDO 8-P phosphatase)
MDTKQINFDQLQLLVLDVDGVLSDGRLYFTNSGEEIKAFNSQDGLGIKLLIQQGIEVAIITGRESHIVSGRASTLGIKHLVQGCEEKLEALDKLASELALGYENIAYMGDDLPDLAPILRVGLGMTVADANPEIKSRAAWCSTRKGGEGAVREACDFILKQRGNLDDMLNDYL